MKFKSPDIQVHFDSIMTMDTPHVDSIIKPILAIMNVFGSPLLRLKTQELMPTDASWRPSSLEYRELINFLTASENREALRCWYAQFKGKVMNETSELLCRILSELTGEDLREGKTLNKFTVNNDQ
jgi:hypothetical protein